MKFEILVRNILWKKYRNPQNLSSFSCKSFQNLASIWSIFCPSELLLTCFTFVLKIKTCILLTLVTKYAACPFTLLSHICFCLLLISQMIDLIQCESNCMLLSQKYYFLCGIFSFCREEKARCLFSDVYQFKIQISESMMFVVM